MKTPEIPANEVQRLKALRSLHLLDTLPEERFDRVTRMARRLFGVPIALVSLVDENRQWFKSNCGLGAATETPRDISLCGHAILGNDILFIPDTLQDDRFADNPLVKDSPHIRFYAGCPLSYSGDLKMGTLCLIDDKPRQFDAEDAVALRDLASMVEDELRAFQASTSDELTQISNRRGFISLAGHMLHHCQMKGVKASLIFIDLDKFKLINDTYGHGEGDRALIYFSELMKRVFGYFDVIARLGGDEFVALMGSRTKSEAEQGILALQRYVDEHNASQITPYQLAFSYGIVEFDPSAPHSLETLLAEGDSIMYRIKKSKFMQG
ncbi:MULTISPECIES: sensor domain-containing diguanylate cyclase [Serratia]|jgi:diguanylate cyclase (GGDEF)-like protein|uniref:sensor domain-containing diguanylate cyclase n=1 Tax=Serratia TaxID=613 RepID=UPI0003A4DED7|nr:MULTISPECIES: sensor domain-containing diguanylate cyclase [Serratia]MBE0153229.1 sensor domain-containing diguanylate cyclase [Serratia fonticola]MDQ7207807.1 sensor domain-containing diguanylate cyclase [Serratia fonticola]OKP26723.1 GGDEF domain-containing protein [Serratia fonticola]CAI2150900.1 Probable diguanylate cyclase YeaP [Serratia fonticola]HBE9078045.1 sensor domain-containing diguanylate cyclase [Serratia fonticola]